MRGLGLRVRLARLDSSTTKPLPFRSYYIMGSWVGIHVMVREWLQIFFASIFGLVLEMSRGTELVVESFLLGPYLTKAPWSALIFSNSAGPHQGLSCEPYDVPRQELLLSFFSLFRHLYDSMSALGRPLENMLLPGAISSVSKTDSRDPTSQKIEFRSKTFSQVSGRDLTYSNQEWIEILSHMGDQSLGGAISYAPAMVRRQIGSKQFITDFTIPISATTEPLFLPWDFSNLLPRGRWSKLCLILIPLGKEITWTVYEEQSRDNTSISAMKCLKQNLISSINYRIGNQTQEQSLASPLRIIITLKTRRKLHLPPTISRKEDSSHSFVGVSLSFPVVSPAVTALFVVELTKNIIKSQDAEVAGRIGGGPVSSLISELCRGDGSGTQTRSIPLALKVNLSAATQEPTSILLSVSLTRSGIPRVIFLPTLRCYLRRLDWPTFSSIVILQPDIGLVLKISESHPPIKDLKVLVMTSQKQVLTMPSNRPFTLFPLMLTSWLISLQTLDAPE
ncbi:hypothetical protein HN51_058856 [Arachis hypogaea]